MKTFEINGYVGGITKRPATIFVHETPEGTAYVAEGGTMVNWTSEEVTEGIWIDELSDYDCFTWNKPINSIEEFEEALEN